MILDYEPASFSCDESMTIRKRIVAILFVIAVMTPFMPFVALLMYLAWAYRHGVLI